MLTTTAGRILIPTGRGSYVFLGERKLERILASFDRAYPEHTVMSREEVVAAYERAKQFAGE
ncbi:MAG: hypothetical protein ACK4P4_09125 [Allorhizobium sp.]